MLSVNKHLWKKESILKKRIKTLLILIITFSNCIGILTTFTKEISNGKTLVVDSPKDRLELIKEKGVLTVGSSNEIPIAYINPITKEFTGIDGEIVREIARRLGIKKVEMKKIPFSILLSELNNDNDIDIASSAIYVTDDRKKEILFSNILYKEPETIITTRVSRFTFKEDLKDAVIGVQKGTVFVELVQKWQQEGLVKAIKYYDTQSELLQAVNTGKIDACMADSVIAPYILSTEPSLYLKVMDGYKPEFTGMVAIALKKSDVTLANAINKHIDEMKKDKTLLSILKGYGMGLDNFVSVEDGHIYNGHSYKKTSNIIFYKSKD